jgi:hypothetical protein
MTRHVRTLWSVLAITVGAGACEETPAMPRSLMDGGMANPPPVAEATAFASGTRYQARFLRAPGTDPLLLSVHDRMRGLECLFTRDAAGLIRCTGPDTPDLPGADPGAVVEGQLRAVAFGDRLSRTELLTPDGGRFPLVGRNSFQLEDVQWNGACTPVAVTAGDLRCLPPYATTGGLFADSGCFEPIVQQAQDAEPRVAVVAGVTRALGELFTGQVHVGYGNICNPLPIAYHAPLRRPGPPMPDQAVLRLYRAPQGHNDDVRLGLLALHLGAEVIAPARNPRERQAVAYFDRQRNVECIPVRTPAGVRCLAGVPFAPESELRFMDAGCTQPVLTQLAAEVVLLAAADGHPLARATDIRQLGDWYGGAVVDVYRREAGGCVLRPEKNTFRPLTGAGDWQRFAALEEWVGDHRQ